MMIPFGRILVSRPVTLLCLLLTTLWDILTTYATVGDRLWLDGNPFIRALTWRQVIPLQVILLALAVTRPFSWYSGGRRPSGRINEWGSCPLSNIE